MEEFGPMECLARKPTGTSRRRLRLALACCALPWLLSPIGCRPADDEDRGRGRGDTVTPAVEALQARSGTLPLEERLSGVVKAHNQVAIGAEISAPIVDVLVRSGEAVERGQPLVILKDDTLREQLRQAEAAVRLAEASAKAARARVAELEAQAVRTRALAGEALVSQQELETQEAQLVAVEASADEAEARVDEARATLEERRSAIDRTVVRSPVDGRVGQRNAEIGMLADAGAPLFVVGNLDELMVEIPLTEEMLGFLRPGLPVRLTSSSLAGEPIAATLSRISPFLAAGSFSTVGEIDVSNPDGRLRPGMFLTVDVLYGESEEATVVPTSALWDDPGSGRRGLYVVDMDGSAASAELSEAELPVEFRAVEVLAEGRGTAGVRGAEPGEWVVTVGQHLIAGQSAKAAKVRSTTWERVLELQGLQKEDLLRGFLDKQQRLARTRGAEPPTSREFMNGT